MCNFLCAQEVVDSMKNFLVKYCDNYNVSSYGRNIPNYWFNGSLNSDELENKIVVFDFWATWCSACHLLTHDIDSLLKVNDICQIIGVNHKESAHIKAKPNVAKAYWEKNQYGFPMVEGKQAEVFAAELKAGHPTLVVVDNNGIIRGQWDSYTPGTVPMLKALVWVLSHPSMQVTKELMFDFVRNKEWILGLYVAERLKYDEDVFWCKFKSLLYVAEWEAFDYVNVFYKSIQGRLGKTEVYAETLWSIIAEIVDADVLAQDLNLFGIQLFEELSLDFETYDEDYVVLDYISRLYWRTGQKDKARSCIAKCLQICREKKLNPQIETYFKQIEENYKDKNGEIIDAI